VAVTSIGGGSVPKHIFLVDDNYAIRKAIRLFLECQPGLQVCAEAIDGLDAVEKARDISPDLIILDFAMPRMDGLKAAPELRALRPNTPIILFTICAENIRSDVAAAAGVSAVVSKSDLAQLQRHIDSLLVAH
jgi:CheY-like chemotaxis protein